MQSQTSRTSAHNCDLAFEAEEVGEIVELHVCFCGTHSGVFVASRGDGIYLSSNRKVGA
jgi:hypothetical protein